MCAVVYVNCPSCACVHIHTHIHTNTHFLLDRHPLKGRVKCTLFSLFITCTLPLFTLYNSRIDRIQSQMYQEKKGKFKAMHLIGWVPCTQSISAGQASHFLEKSR